MNKDYFKNLSKTMIDANEYAFRYGDGKAWDNRKKKISRRYVPRGKVYNRLETLEWKAMGQRVKNIIAETEALIASGGLGWADSDGCGA